MNEMIYNRNWNAVDPFDLFTAPVEKLVRSDMKVVYSKYLILVFMLVEQVQTEARSCDVLCLWLDCDREGENIAFEVIDCVKRVKNQIRILHILFLLFFKYDFLINTSSFLCTYSSRYLESS